MISDTDRLVKGLATPNIGGMNTLTEGFGAYVLARRRALGLTQGELADRIGLNRAHLSQIESGKIGLPAADIRRRLAAALGVRHVDLLIAAGELTPDEAGVPARESLGPHQARLRAMVEGLAEEEADILAGIVAPQVPLSVEIAAARAEREARRRRGLGDQEQQGEGGR
jgi:transcriptional regulator with XRE-family HTH domain